MVLSLAMDPPETKIVELLIGVYIVFVDLVVVFVFDVVVVVVVVVVVIDGVVTGNGST